MTTARLVSASAGTGKTYWIVQQIVTLLQQPDTQLDRIGVITFTEAAAAELRARVGSALKAVNHPAADQIAGSPITTINGFALGLLQRHGMLLGLPAKLETLDDVRAKELRARALAQVLEDAEHAGRMDALRDALDTRKTEEIEALIYNLIEKARCLRADASELLAQGQGNAELIRTAFGEPTDAQALDRALAAAFQAAEAVLPRHDLKKTDMPILEAYAQSYRLFTRNEPRKAATAAAKLRKATKDTEPLLAAVREVAARWLRHHPAALDFLLATSDAAYTLAAAAMARYAQAKTAAECLDFSDQIGLALDLLERDVGGTQLAALVAQEMPYLFVDEFQDTSPLQFRLCETLREQGCQVSYVGDLKQAIYGWRDADSRLMGALLTQAADSATPPHTLADNWRSHPALVAFANDLFEPLFGSLAVDFQRVRAAGLHTQVSLPAAPCVELLMQEKPHYPKPGMIIPRLQALVAAGHPVLDRDARALRPVRWSDFAILERGNKHLDEWAEALAAAGLPFMRELGGWSAQPEVRTATAWLRCLANPFDTLALANALCSDMFGLAADQLGTLAAAGFFRQPAQCLAEDEAFAAVEAALAAGPDRLALQHFRGAWLVGVQGVRFLPLSRGIRAALEACDAFDHAAPGQATANLVKLVELAATLEGQGTRSLRQLGLTGATLENYLPWLGSLGETNLDKQPLITQHGSGGIQLLTMHRAKGLEFPVVVIPRLPLDVAAAESRCEVRWPDDATAFLGAELFGQSQLRFIPPHADVGDLRARFGQAEADAASAVDDACLLYVAFTRARDYLLVGWTNNARAGGAQELLAATLGGDRLAGHPVVVTPCAASPLEPSSSAAGVQARVPKPKLVVARREPKVETTPLPKTVVSPLVGRLALDGHEPRALGLAVHEALRAAHLGPDDASDKDLARRLIARWGPALTEPALEAVRIVRALVATLELQEMRCEWPVLIAGPDGPRQQWLDLLGKGPRGYVVLDYKLDLGEPGAIARHHGEQLYRYRQAVSALVGEVPETAVVALGSGTLVRFVY